MKTLDQIKQETINSAQAYANILHSITGFTYRVRWLFTGANIEAWSVQKNKWYIVRVHRSR